jgi:phosphoribosylglycinamide formyltransferase-1
MIAFGRIFGADPRLAFLASHNGTGMRAVIDAVRQGRLSANPKIAVSNNADSAALHFASKYGLVAVHLSQKKLGREKDLDAELLSLLVSQDVDIVVLSGYLRRLGPKVLRHFAGRILNVHPSLLPSFGGKACTEWKCTARFSPLAKLRAGRPYT